MELREFYVRDGGKAVFRDCQGMIGIEIRLILAVVVFNTGNPRRHRKI